MSLLRIDYGFLLGIASACVVAIMAFRFVESHAKKRAQELTRRALSETAVRKKEE